MPVQQDSPNILSSFIRCIHQRSLAAALAASATVLLLLAIVFPTATIAQGIDPSDVWFKGFLEMKDGEQMEEQGDLLGAFNKYSYSKQLLDAVYREHPDYHPSIVRYRRKFLADKMVELKAQMAEANRGGGNIAPVTGPTDGSPSMAATPTTPQVSAGGIELPARQAAPGLAPVGSSPEFPAPIQTPTPGGNGYAYDQPDILDGNLAINSDNPFVALQQQYQQMKSRVDQLTTLNNQLSQQLSSQQQQLVTYQTQLQKARQDEQVLRQQMEANTGGSPETVKELKKQLTEAVRLATEANKRSDSLLAELETSRSEVAILKTERASILRERDQLAAVIDQDAGKKQLAQLMSENERLRSELEESRELAEKLRGESGDKDTQLTVLKNKLAQIEQQRTQLLSDNSLHQKHIAELQQHLKDLGKESLIGPSVDLAAADGQSDKAIAENGLLRDIVLRQLSRQNQLKQAKEALIDQLKDMGIESASLLASIDDIVDGASMTATEKEMIRQPDFDDSTGPMETTVIVEGAESDGSGSGIVSVQSLQEELDQVQKAARLDFREGNLEASLKGYEEYLRLQPRSVEGTCNLALVHLRMDQPEKAESLLEKAVALDKEAGRPYYLLGVMYFRQGKMDDALNKLELGLAREPENARAHNYVGVICSQKGLEKRAETSFNNAVTHDSEFADPHFNLAVLFTTGETPDAAKAREHYLRARELGADRDGAIEQFLEVSAATRTPVLTIAQH